jgi:hypothetical protein
MDEHLDVLTRKNRDLIYVIVKNIGMCVLLTALFGILRKTEGLPLKNLRSMGGSEQLCQES